MFGFRGNKNFELVVLERQNYLAILTKMPQCLEAAGHNAQAKVVEKLIGLIDTNDLELFTKQINNIGMWGGAGAVWEVYIEDKNKAKEFQKEIIHLIDLMEKTNILGRGIKPIKKAFETDI
jgi:hypothetical protein